MGTLLAARKSFIELHTRWIEKLRTTHLAYWWDVSALKSSPADILVYFVTKPGIEAERLKPKDHGVDCSSDHFTCGMNSRVVSPA